jgi:hypothetical protein
MRRGNEQDARPSLSVLLWPSIYDDRQQAVDVAGAASSSPQEAMRVRASVDNLRNHARGFLRHQRRRGDFERNHRLHLPADAAIKAPSGAAMSSMKDLLGDTLFAERYPQSPGHRGVDTSIAAAASIKPHVSRIAQDILDHLKTCGTHGATYTELMAAMGLGAPTMSARLRELALKNCIRPTECRRPTPSGRAARVYVLAETERKTS